MTSPTAAVVTSVSRNETYRFSKPARNEIVLVPGLGVEGDVHAGVTVKHRGRVAVDPTRPNLRQVHLIHAELHDELRQQGFDVTPGQLGENVTTLGLDLLALPRGTVLRFGAEGAAVEITGLRNPCEQINTFRPGLLKRVLGRDDQGRLVRKAGIMSVVLAGGAVRPGDPVTVELPVPPHEPLRPV
ncbi:MAG TPA: MOSC domain-containing protein [Actinoplanes sp.]